MTKRLEKIHFSSARPLAAQCSGCHVSYVFIIYIKATRFAQAIADIILTEWGHVQSGNTPAHKLKARRSQQTGGTNDLECPVWQSFRNRQAVGHKRNLFFRKTGSGNNPCDQVASPARCHI
jgi:hypothetical protein